MKAVEPGRSAAYPGHHLSDPTLTRSHQTASDATSTISHVTFACPCCPGPATGIRSCIQPVPVAGGNSGGRSWRWAGLPQSAQRKRKAVIGRSASPALDELRERCLAPAIAAQAVELQGVIAREQVGDRVQVNGAGHRPSLRSDQVQGVSPARCGQSLIYRARLRGVGFDRVGVVIYPSAGA